MQIRKLLSKIFVCISSLFLLCGVSFAANNYPLGEIAEYGNWFNEENLHTLTNSVSTDFQNFDPHLNIDEAFVPIEAKLGLMFMKALSSIDYILQNSLVSFTIIFLLIMYAFWVMLHAYKTMGEPKDYKTLLYTIFKQGITIAVWIVILKFGLARIFSWVISPILATGTYLSDFILSMVAKTYDVNIPNTCAAIHKYVATNNIENLLVDTDTAVNIMCLPSRISVFFYKAVASGFTWIKSGLTTSVTQVVVGIFAVVVFIKCIFKYAFMTLGVVADLFLTLLLIPFTAVAESLVPAPDGKAIPGRIYNGFMTLFTTNKSVKKVSGVLGVFINAAIYFISLSIMIAICAALLSNIISLDNHEFKMAPAMTILLAGCFVLYLADKTDEYAKKIGGSIDNTVGQKLDADAKVLWDDVKKLTSKVTKKVINK